jgi:hypothetical protein
MIAPPGGAGLGKVIVTTTDWPAITVGLETVMLPMTT